MQTFTLVTDSASDLTYEMQTKFAIDVFPLHLNIKEETYLDMKDESTIKFADFYNRMRKGAVATTSAVSVGIFEEAFEKYAKEGKDILYIAFSSGLSTTYNSGLIAAKSVLEKYPERKIYVVDSLAASRGQGLLVYLCALKKEEGASIEEVRDYAEKIKLNICHFFTVDDLVYLKRGGRISAATALVGGLLNIKPLLHVDNEGHLISIGKSKGRKASIVALTSYIESRALPETKKVAFICHGDCLDDANYLAQILKEKYGFEDVQIGYTGPVIGAHSGPGTLALFFVGGER